MDSCVCCGASEIAQIEKAHVKNKSFLIDDGVKDHEFQNILFLCTDCHTDFDNYQNKGNIAIKLKNKQYIFCRLFNGKRPIKEFVAQYDLNIAPEYIEWKNKRVHHYLKMYLKK